MYHHTYGVAAANHSCEKEKEKRFASKGDAVAQPGFRIAGSF